jgi:hypothetical protein
MSSYAKGQPPRRKLRRTDDNCLLGRCIGIASLVVTEKIALVGADKAGSVTGHNGQDRHLDESTPAQPGHRQRRGCP